MCSPFPWALCSPLGPVSYAVLVALDKSPLGTLSSKLSAEKFVLPSW